ncbi:MAG: hypothetical protein AABX98_01685 [Nanoarchaeota archaeon]
MEKRILLDTSVYGKLAEDDTLFTLLLDKKKIVDMVFYGCTIIRNELRATPKEIREMNKSLRLHLLYLYDSLITKEHHNLLINEFVEILAKKYMVEYKKHDRNISYGQMESDFFIVALATIYQMDIVVSNDRRTLLSNPATEAYEIVNTQQGFRNPKYLHYDMFKRKIFTGSDI